jgi:hypothetical protein
VTSRVQARRLLLAVFACGLLSLAIPSNAAACLAYSISTEVEHWPEAWGPPNTIVVASVDGGSVRDDQLQMQTDQVIAGSAPQRLVLRSDDGFSCHPPNVRVGDRVLLLSWPGPTRSGEILVVQTPMWVIDETGQILPTDWQFTINGDVPKSVADVLHFLGKSMPDSATDDYRGVDPLVAVGMAMLVVALLVLSGSLKPPPLASVPGWTRKARR